MSESNVISLFPKEVTPPPTPRYYEEISFMEPRSSKQGGGINYWVVPGSYEYSLGWKVGKELAQEFQRYVARWPTCGNATLLHMIVADMMKRDAVKSAGKLTSVEMGFLNVVSEYAMCGAIICKAH